MPTLSGFTWFIKGRQLGIAQESPTTGSMIATTDNIVIDYQGPRYANKLEEDNLLAEPEIPPEFHRALIAYVLMEYFEEQGDIKNYRIWELVWRRKLNRARALASEDLRRGPIHLMRHDF